MWLSFSFVYPKNIPTRKDDYSRHFLCLSGREKGVSPAWGKACNQVFKPSNHQTENRDVKNAAQSSACIEVFSIFLAVKKIPGTTSNQEVELKRGIIQFHPMC
jgi:hypothetical protein